MKLSRTVLATMTFVFGDMAPVIFGDMAPVIFGGPFHKVHVVPPPYRRFLNNIEAGIVQARSQYSLEPQVLADDHVVLKWNSA
jgi:hypothetical protein